MGRRAGRKKSNKKDPAPTWDEVLTPRYHPDSRLLQSGLFVPGNEGIRLFLMTGGRSEKPLGSELPLVLTEARLQPVAGPL